MADFLVAAKNNWMVDADKTGWTQEQIDDAERQYKIGDIVDIFEDGKLSDYAHAGGKFYVLRIKGLTKNDAMKYIEVEYENILTKGVQDKRIVRKRMYKFRIDDMPVLIKNKIKTDYVYTINWSDIKGYCFNKKTLLNEV